MQIVLFDLRDGQHRVLAITAGWIFAQQKLEGIDGALVILFVKQIAHGAIQLGDLIQRRGNFRSVRRDQIHALIVANQGSVVLERAGVFRTRFERLAVFFRAVELSLGRFAAGEELSSARAMQRKKGQDHNGREKDAQDWPDCSGVMPHVCLIRS